jgi:hypothetical protein
MAMSTWLQAVTAEEIAELRAQPDTINQLDKPHCYRTHFGPSINYFVLGSAYPGERDGPMWPMLQGATFVDTRTLENGSFGLVSPAQAAELAALLAGVDIAAVAARVAGADFDDLVDEEELYDLELITQEEGPELIAGELESLVEFYTETARTGLGVVSYTT